MTRNMPENIKKAHAASFQNREVVKRSQMCGCFFCCKTFPASEVEDFCIDREDLTALCPYCAIDSVIPDASGWPVDAAFLKKMKRYWFW